ncbi:hypothetical protein JAAARDRAFT_55292 [Jaapia argillacea MUCL 33604]|uniref:Uncharacterized protein n=1 Tax=Jaapia argillacea MUCL 33604 TaxID=933084 RepID=A0A067Q0F7_9AGAM|nr:hypothetical protein JAAARDRAFT_55292 [Jaapia argillacea MUCL 33604]
MLFPGEFLRSSPSVGKHPLLGSLKRSRVHSDLLVGALPTPRHLDSCGDHQVITVYGHGTGKAVGNGRMVLQLTVSSREEYPIILPLHETSSLLASHLRRFGLGFASWASEWCAWCARSIPPSSTVDYLSICGTAGDKSLAHRVYALKRMSESRGL